MPQNPESKPKGSAVRAWVAAGQRPVRGKGGRGRLGDIGRFLRREAEEIVRGREDEGLTWDDVAMAAAQAGIAKPDGSPFPGASFSTIWGRLVRRGIIQPHTAQPGPTPATGARPQHQVPDDQIRPRESPSRQGQAGDRSVGLPPPTPTVTTPPRGTSPNSTQNEPRAPPSGSPLPAGFEDLLNPGVSDPKKPNPPKL